MRVIRAKTSDLCLPETKDKVNELSGQLDNFAKHTNLVCVGEKAAEAFTFTYTVHWAAWTFTMHIKTINTRKTIGNR